MPNSKIVKSKTLWGVFFAALFAGVLLTACGGGGGGSPNVAPSGGGGGGGGGGPAPGAITGISSAGGVITVTSANTLAVGDIVAITGTTNFNGAFPVTSANAGSFTFAAPPGPPAASEATGSWVFVAGVIAGCTPTTTGTAGAITLPSMAAVPSRFTGVAPLAVFFDATGTTATAAPARPFHDLEYRWGFGDPAGGATWANGSRAGVSSKNSATGPVAAHVFETPGTYVVNLTVLDGTNTVSNSCVQIAVQDPDVVFAGANTICFSTSGNFTDAPAGFCTVPGPIGTPGATAITTNDFDAAIGAYLAPGKRLLFRADAAEVYLTSVSAKLDKNGPWTIGKFGAGAKALVRRDTSTSILGIGSGTSNGAGFGDGRVMDLDLDGQSFATSNAFIGSGDLDQLTVLRVSMHDVHNGVTLSATVPGLTKVWDQLSIVDSSVSNVIGGSGGVGIFGEATRFALLGTTVNDSSLAEHCVRFMWLEKAVLSNNTITTPAPTKSSLTLRAPDFATGLGIIPSGTYSRWVVVSDNKISGGSGVQIPIQIGGDGADDSRNRDYIVERNYIPLPIGATPLTGVMVFSSDALGPVTVRNNIIDLSGSSAAGQTGVKVATNGLVPSPIGVMVYNNTVVTSDAATTFRGIWIDTLSTDSIVKNNLVFAPTATTVFSVLDGGTGTIGASGTFGNSSDLQASGTAPGFANPALTEAAHFIVTSGYALNGGTTVPVFSDFFGVSRPTGVAPDIGASEQ